MKRKGQAAMEFLMTYGWAILAAIIVIGVLAIYFRPTGLTSGQSKINSPEFHLIAANADVSDNQLHLDIRNDGAETVTLTTIAVDAGLSADCTVSPGTTLAVGANAVYDLTCPGAAAEFSDGDAVTGDITVTYTTASSTIVQEATGNFAESAQA